MKRIVLSTALFFLMQYGCFAQDSTIEMADEMRASGKIYVVVAVLAVILIGIFFYLFSIDRKLNKLEQEVKKQ